MFDQDLPRGSYTRYLKKWHSILGNLIRMGLLRHRDVTFSGYR